MTKSINFKFSVLYSVCYIVPLFAFAAAGTIDCKLFMLFLLLSGRLMRMCLLKYMTADGHLTDLVFLQQTRMAFSSTLDLGTERNMKRYSTIYISYYTANQIAKTSADNSPRSFNMFPFHWLPLFMTIVRCLISVPYGAVFSV